MRKKVEDVIRDLWIAINEDKREVRTSEIDVSILKELERQGFIEVHGDKLKLTDKGEELGRKIIRLHRLTERLLFDILGMEEEIYEKAACSLEHVVTEELEEAICTLLGHPKICPHGKPIPPGRCCVNHEKLVKRIVYPLNELYPGDEGKLSYIYSRSPELVNRLMSLGLIPGRRIKVLKKFPSYIVQVGNTQIALDEEIAKNIYVIKPYK